MSARLAELQVAVMLLTRLPAGRLAGRAPSLARAAWAFPLAGALVGALAWAAFAVAQAAGLGGTIAALLAVAVALLATGGLHEDGLADLADGLGGGADRAAKLEIMRDSRIGSYGVLALIVALGLRVAGIEAAEPGLAAFLALGAGSRACMVVVLVLVPPARADGLGRSAGGVNGGAAAAAAGLAAMPLLALGAVAVPAALALAVAAAAVARLARRQLGGQTGDVLGAVAVTAEVAGWLVLAA